MAHQAHALPWQTLANNFKFVHANSRYRGRTDLYPRFKDGQGNQLQHFAKVFARLMDDFSKQERAKYPADVTPPEPGEVFIPDSTVKRIAKTVKEYRTPSSNNNHRSDEDTELQLEQRQIRSWLSNLRIDSCHLYYRTRETLELLKTMILYGEMEPLLRLAAHPEIWLPRVWNVDDWSVDVGWSELKDTALAAYICLNVFFIKPELYDVSSRRERLKQMKQCGEATPLPDEMDYRLTGAYQSMLVRCTWTRYSNYESCAYPHREFFGVPRGWFTEPASYWHNRFGQAHLSQLVNEKFRNYYIPSKADVPAVINLLGKKGLPSELALQVLQFSDYTPKSRLPIPEDPLHVDNGEELKKYLSYCWKLLVRIDVLLKANGSWVDWEFEVTEAIYKLFGPPYPKMSRLVECWEYEGRSENEVDTHRRRRFFT